MIAAKSRPGQSRLAWATIAVSCMLAMAVSACATAPATGNVVTLQESNRAKAVYCMDLLFNQHDIDASRRECFGETYIQHNPMAPDGVDAVLGFMESYFASTPTVSIEIKRTAADGDLVWIHYLSKANPEDRGLAVVDILRMENGRFAEHWDVVQPVPAESANDNTMF